MGMVLPETSKVVFQCVRLSAWELNAVVFKDVFSSTMLECLAGLCLVEAVADTLVGVMESHCLFNLHFSAG